MILVDFSGTIAKHRDVVGKIFEELDYPFFKERGFEGTEDELKGAFREASRSLRLKENRQGDFSTEVAKILGITVKREDAVRKGEMFDDMYVEHIQLVDGAADGIAELSKLDEVVILTNARCRRVIPAVEKFGIKDSVQQIICLGGTGESKGWEIFKKMKSMGAWVIVGDSPRKDGAAEDHGISFIDVRVGWGTTVNLVKGLEEEKIRFKA